MGNTYILLELKISRFKMEAFLHRISNLERMPNLQGSMMQRVGVHHQHRINGCKLILAMFIQLQQLLHKDLEIKIPVKLSQVIQLHTQQVHLQV